MNWLDVFCGISKGTFEIPHKIYRTYLDRYDLYTTLIFEELLDSRAHTRFLNACQNPDKSRFIKIGKTKYI